MIPKKKQPKKPPHSSSGGRRRVPMERMVRQHMDLLQNVEFVLANGYRQDPSIDDVIARDVLHALIKSEAPEDERAVMLVERMLEIEEARPEISEQLWRDAYHVVLESVQTHSTLQPGAQGYLEFVSPSVP